MRITISASSANRGHTEEAIAYFTEALRIRPDYKNAENNLKLAPASHGKGVP